MGKRIPDPIRQAATPGIVSGNQHGSLYEVIIEDMTLKDLESDPVVRLRRWCTGEDDPTRFTMAVLREDEGLYEFLRGCRLVLWGGWRQFEEVQQREDGVFIIVAGSTYASA